MEPLAWELEPFDTPFDDTALEPLFEEEKEEGARRERSSMMKSTMACRLCHQTKSNPG